MDLIQDNPQTQAGGEIAGTEPSGDLKEIMGSMAAGKEPDAEPAGDMDGENAEGKTKAAEELPAWFEQLPAELKTGDYPKTLGKFKKIGDLAKSYSELERKHGNSVTIPSEESSDEEKAAFYRKIGKPDSVDGYSVPDKDSEFFRQIAYDNNLTVKQAEGVLKGILEHGVSVIKDSQDKIDAMVKTADEELRREYGNAYPEKMQLLKRGIRDYGGNELGNKLLKAGLLYDPQVVSMFVALGEQNAEAGAVSRGAGGGKSGYVSTADGGMFTFKDLK